MTALPAGMRKSISTGSVVCLCAVATRHDGDNAMTEKSIARPIRVDAHHHFWPQPTGNLYPWMTDDLAALRRPFGPDDLRPLIQSREIDWTVLVQTRSSLDETREFLAIADATEFVAGV